MKPTPTPERIRVAQDADGFWTCREAISGSQEYVRADIYEAALSVQPAAAVVGEPVAWLFEDELPENYPYDIMFPFSKVDGVRLFPVYVPSAPDGWQPIETAPRDGTVILARYQWGGESRFLVIRLSNMHSWWVTDHDGLIKHDEEKVSIRNYNFTHWRPLPAPPAIGGSHE